jgi:hypothetical protein
MGVLCECISVIVRRDSIEERLPHAGCTLESLIPNRTFHQDQYIACVGFMDPDDVGIFVRSLERVGLTFIRDDRCVDIAVVDRNSGPTAIVEWLGVSYLTEDSSKVEVMVANLNGKFRTGSQVIEVGEPDGSFVAYPEWQPERSATRMVLNKDVGKNLRRLGTEGNLETYLDLKDGRVVYTGRPYRDGAGGSG